ncbi:MAG TPA: transcription-repair coupling factor [Thermodesulfobacteriota bacterium]|nr:transcription-repair coupling factor [Thermodesulfobacteriota bacterium]
MSAESRFKSDNIEKVLKQSGRFRDLSGRLKSGKKSVSLPGLKGSSKFFLLHALLKTIGRPALFIYPDKKKAEAAACDLSFFLGAKPPVLLKRELTDRSAIFSSPDGISEGRIAWLEAAASGRVVVAEAEALFEKTMPVEAFRDSVMEIGKGALLAREELTERLAQSGYRAADFVQGPGETSTRGAIVDIYPPGAEDPVRVEFIGDEIGSLRYFSAGDQRSRGRVSSVSIPPASEVIMTGPGIERAVEYLKRRAGDSEVTARDKFSLVDEIEAGRRVPNMEWLLPAFYEEPGTVFDYLSDNFVIVNDFPEETEERLRLRAGAPGDEAAPARRHLKIAPGEEELFLSGEDVSRGLSEYQNISLPVLEAREAGGETIRFDGRLPEIETRKEHESPLDALIEEIDEAKHEGYELHVVFKTETELEKLLALLRERGVKKLRAHTGDLSHGFILPEAGVEVVTEWDILGEKKERRAARRGKDAPSAFITSFSELRPGDYIVHVDFGIGIFRSLKRLRIGNAEGDFIQCEYAGGDKIYVPIDKLKLVQRYIGDGKPHKVDRLGHQGWSLRVKKVRTAVESVARELLELYARRKARKGYAFSPKDDMFREFELAFEYEETPDQEAAIEDVMRDMEAPMPMDRLICGDVGFGKTEVALRAAFRAVEDGKQVAFLVPTTLLAQQHYNTARRRMAGYPVGMEQLSRWQAGKEAARIRHGLEEGKIDMVIGTHALLGEKVKFRDLGLVIVDEEHRFGVAQKEKLRKLKEGVDAIAMSATPIPRTLQLSLAKIRDISLINTPPEGRQAIETHIYKSSPEIIVEAAARELARGGAVFFIHNRIESIYRTADKIRKLLPEASIEVTHGKMSERELERSISRFIEGDVDILVTTAIVESGLDIPRANTIIIDNAHTFGLADLYQLRGRVGRSDKKAYAYMLIPAAGGLSEDARRRLQAISELKELGSGYKLALSDLEIRGAGHLFGTEQSGHIADVGLELYLDMLEGAVRRLEGQEDTDEREPEISFSSPAFIPDTYIENEAERLLFYKRLSSAASLEEAGGIAAELADRFGDLPAPAAGLIGVIELRIVMRKLGVEKADITGKRTAIQFSPKSRFYASYPPQGRLELYFETENPIEETRAALDALGGGEKAAQGAGKRSVKRR